MAKLLSVNLLQRVLVAAVGIPLLLFVIMAGGGWFFGFFLLLSLLATFEFHRLAALKASPPALPLMLFLTLLLQGDLYFRFVELWVVLLGAVMLLFLLELFSHEGSPLLNLGSALAGLLYVNLSFGALLRLRMEPMNGSGEAWVLLMFVSIWATDISAYFGGSLAGGKVVARKLFERHSPNKTWEGFFFGVAGSVAAAWAFSALVPEVGTERALLAGLLIGLFSPAGDLIESMFKRDAGVKDSSSLIPGHGGVLDRFDTVMFVAPFLYLLTR
ncbi:phosphatidate cytidylyltransferase [Chlorobium sp. N1]|uniref:phosphatidate cytidylyltransferase n=1 Tax=Chlorobium sp. N1 TaxID=2491138 RepID=UPI00103C761B|nr:phosphatidate cytidylyltransferase [Chlorobium sp. N1]TCD48915.1 phosphatidate cytidylyltransferase [Chlorobium sp. N1]